MMKQVDAPYYNHPQLAVKLNSSPFKMLVWGRGTGKTTILADDCLDDVLSMPRCKIGFCGLTYFHIRTKSLPAMIDQWERLGFYRGVHFFVGHKPPKKWNWPEPYQPPLDYSNIVIWFNGSAIEFISFDRPEMARSGNYDAIKGDEAAKLKKSALDSDVLASNRGNRYRFGHHRKHHGWTFTTTQPVTPEGQWVWQIEELMKEELRQGKKYRDYLYLEASARDNLAVLGERYFRDNKRVMPEVVYNLEILNKRPNFNINGFYPLLDIDNKHGYFESFDYHFYDNQDVLTKKEPSIDSRGDADCKADEPLYVSIDFGSRINCLVVALVQGTVFPTIKNLYVEHPLILDDLVKAFVKYYRFHRNKTVFLYGGSDGNRRHANSTLTYFEQAIKLLEAEGWLCILNSTLREPYHEDKFIFWNTFLKGDQPNLPKFVINRNNAEETIISMQNAAIKPAEIKKDKSSERDEELPQWKATHLSGAMDNLYYWLFAERTKSSGEFVDVHFGNGINTQLSL